jgi:hypothetical protein
LRAWLSADAVRVPVALEGVDEPQAADDAAHDRFVASPKNKTSAIT